jgi:hypothetical protein
MEFILWNSLVLIEGNGSGDRTSSMLLLNFVLTAWEPTEDRGKDVSIPESHILWQRLLWF